MSPTRQGLEGKRSSGAMALPPMPPQRSPKALAWPRESAALWTEQGRSLHSQG